MVGEKPWWQSWTLWSAFATFIGVLLPSLGINVAPDQVTGIFKSAYQFLDALLTFGGLIMVVYSRATATHQLTRR